MDNYITKPINRIFCFTLLIFSVSVIFVVSKYIGIISLISKILKALIPIFIAVFVSFLFEPLIGIFVRRGIKRKYSVLLSYSLIIIIVALLLYFTIPSLIEQISVFIENIPSLIMFMNDFIGSVGMYADKGNVNDTINNIIVNSSVIIAKVLSSSALVFYNLLLGLSGAIFLSFDFPMFKERIKKYIPNRIKKPVIYYFQKFIPFVHKYFSGILLDSILIFLISAICFYVIGLDYVLVVSLFVAITNLIPIIGPYIGGILAVIIGFSVNSTLGISALIVTIFIQIFESNFLQPLILKNAIKLHPVEGILGISLFGALFGVIGMVLSPILVTAFKLLFYPYENTKEEQVQGTFFVEDA